MLKSLTKLKIKTRKKKNNESSASSLNGSTQGLNYENGDSNTDTSKSGIVSNLSSSHSVEVLNNGDSSSSGIQNSGSSSALSSAIVDLTPSKPENTSISAAELLNTFTMKHADEDRLFRAEFEAISPYMRSQKRNFEHARSAENKEKNRYRNVITCDESRVVLSRIDDKSGSDYINASFINHLKLISPTTEDWITVSTEIHKLCEVLTKKGHNHLKKFIAAQGPKENTVDDFWRMIWEQRCYVIVMITELREVGRYISNKLPSPYRIPGQKKCEKYWPDEGSAEYGKITVELESIFEYGGFTKRLLKVKHCDQADEEPRKIFQFQYRAWPDHGVPKTTSEIFRFRQRTLEAQPQDLTAGPVVVHCSAGVGRTGTYIALDKLLGELEDKKEVDVCSLVVDMRLRRTEMVQSLDQYVLLHKLVKEYFIFGNTDVPADEFDELYERMLKLDDDTHMNGFDTEFSLLCKSHPVNRRVGSGLLPANKEKNRDEEVVSYDHSKVFVGMRPSEQAPLYYNASNLEGYDVNSNLIASQDPFKNTIEDFWRVVIDNYVTCVVMLTPLQEDDDENCVQYWPNEEVEDYGEITVKMNSQDEREFFVESHLTVKSDHLSSEITHVRYPAWKNGDDPPTRVGDALLAIAHHVSEELVKKQNNVKSRVLIHCSDGAGRTGVLCSLVNLLERLKREDRIDVFRSVKDLRDCRPLMVRTKEQYKLCYDVMKLHLSKRDNVDGA